MSENQEHPQQSESLTLGEALKAVRGAFSLTNGDDELTEAEECITAHIIALEAENKRLKATASTHEEIRIDMGTRICVLEAENTELRKAGALREADVFNLEFENAVLLEALKTLSGMWESLRPNDRCLGIMNARAAIQKAEGE
jgi:hypothetical protein